MTHIEEFEISTSGWECSIVDPDDVDQITFPVVSEDDEIIHHITLRNRLIEQILAVSNHAMFEGADYHGVGYYER